MKKQHEFTRIIKLSLSLVIVFTMCMTRVYGTSDVTSHSTDQTFISDGGEYSLAYILSHYNAFTFEDYKGTHVVGPMIVGKNAGRTTLNGGSGHLSIGGLSTSLEQTFPHLVASYIKGEAQIGDTITTHSKVPFYLGTVNQNKSYTLVDGNKQNYYDYYFTDQYVDFNQAKLEIEKDASIYQDYEGPGQNGEIIHKIELDTDNDFNYFQNHPDQDKYENTYYTVYKDNVNNETKLAYKLKLGNNYHFNSFDLVSAIIYDYEPDSQPSSKTTIISCDDQKIESFPAILKSQSDGMGTRDGLNLAGEVFYQFDSIESGQSISITYICPNATQIEIGNGKIHKGIDKLNGHLVAVNADVKIESGDYNGSLIVKSVDSKAEGHMWTYQGIITPGSLELTLNKRVNHQVPQESFDFQLEQVLGPHDASITRSFQNGILTTKSLKDGSIHFKLDGFDRVGTYIYQIKEMNQDQYICTPEKLYAKVEVIQSGKYMLPQLIGYYLDENCNQQVEPTLNNISKNKVQIQKIWKDQNNDDIEAPVNQIQVNVYRQAYRQDGHYVNLCFVQNVDGKQVTVKEERIFVKDKLSLDVDASILATGQSYYIGGISNIITSQGNLKTSNQSHSVYGEFNTYGKQTISLSSLHQDVIVTIELKSSHKYQNEDIHINNLNYTSGALLKEGTSQLYQTVTLNKDQGWKTSLDVPAYRKDGLIYHYYIQEQNPTGYDVTYKNGENSSTIASDIEAINDATLELINKQKEKQEEHHYLNITKIDQDDHTKKLKNAQFVLLDNNDELNFKKDNGIYYYDPDGKDNLTSDDQGEIKIDLDSLKSLNIKDYLLKEKKTPEGYLKTFDKIKLHLDCDDTCYYKIDDEAQVNFDEHEIHHLEIGNVKQDSIIKIPNTGHTGYQYMVIGFVLTILSFIGLIIYRKQGGKGNV